jgi:hypothetical protein
VRLDLGVDAAMSTSIASIRASIRDSRKRWCSSNRPVNASSSWPILVRVRDRG